MIRNLKPLGLAFAAVAAIGALAASSAQAAPGELHSEVAAGKTTAILTGEISAGTHVFTVKGDTLKCTIAKLEGVVQKSTTDATITPQYTGCTYIGELAGEVKMNGCKYTLTGAANFTANVDVVGCTSGKSIEFIDIFCKITVPEQTKLGHVVYTNNAGPPKDITASVTLSGVTYIGDNTIANGCGEAAGHHADGTLSGTTTIRSFEDEGLNQLVTHNGHQSQPFKCGKQVGLFST